MIILHFTFQYPVFVHMYLELVYNGHENEAKKYVAEFGQKQEPFYQDDIKKLSYITKQEHMKGSELMENFRTSQFTVRMSRDTYTQLRQQKKFMAEKKHAVLWNIIQEHLYLDVYEGIARNKQQIVATAGGMVGEANRQANRTKVFYGKCSSKFNLTHIKRIIYYSASENLSKPLFVKSYFEQVC